MPISHDMMHAQTHSMFEKAGEALEGVTKLKERIAELENAVDVYKSNANYFKCQVAEISMKLCESQKNHKAAQRALWVTRTAMAKSEKDRWNAHVDCGNRRNRKDPAYVKTGKLLEVGEWRKLWADIECKCFKKAEEYK